MNFEESTQHRNWKFTAEQLRQLRQENRNRSLEALGQKALSTPAVSLPSSASVVSIESASTVAEGASQGVSNSPAPEPLTFAEEAELLKYYGSRLQHVCRELKLPRRVLGAALTYLKRIYLSCCCLEQDPQQLLLTCLYLACKIEEHYISAAELGRLTGAPAEVILRTELAALQGLKFDLIVFSPYKAVDGFLEDVRQAAAEAHSGDGTAAAVALDPGLAGLQEELLARARAAAYAAADTLMLSDAPLLHAPGRLALAAVRSAFNKLGIHLQRYVERVARRSSGNGGDWQAAVRQLQSALSELDALGAEAAKPVDQARVVVLNQRLKACRGLLQGSADPAAAKAKAKADKQARKAAKAAEQRSTAEAALGIQPVSLMASAAGQPPAKRLKHDE